MERATDDRLPAHLLVIRLPRSRRTRLAARPNLVTLLLGHVLNEVLSALQTDEAVHANHRVVGVFIVVLFMDKRHLEVTRNLEGVRLPDHVRAEAPNLSAATHQRQHAFVPDDERAFVAAWDEVAKALHVRLKAQLRSRHDARLDGSQRAGEQLRILPRSRLQRTRPALCGHHSRQSLPELFQGGRSCKPADEVLARLCLNLGCHCQCP